jgi:hypothetical protein
LVNRAREKHHILLGNCLQTADSLPRTVECDNRQSVGRSEGLD